MVRYEAEACQGTRIDTEDARFVHATRIQVDNARIDSLFTRRGGPRITLIFSGRGCPRWTPIHTLVTRRGFTRTNADQRLSFTTRGLARAVADQRLFTRRGFAQQARIHPTFTRRGGAADHAYFLGT